MIRVLKFVGIGLFLINAFALNAQDSTFQWLKSAGLPDESEGGYIVKGDTSSNIYVAGLFYGASFTIGSTTVKNTVPGATNSPDYFLAKYDASGNLLWLKSGGSDAEDAIGGLAVSADGDAYLAISCLGDKMPLTANYTTEGNRKMVLLKYDAAGKVVWTKSCGVPEGAVTPTGVAVNAAGDLYVAGEFTGEALNAGSQKLTNADPKGTCDVFLIKYTTDGQDVWATRMGGEYNDRARGVVTDAKGNVTIAGYFFGWSATFGSVTLENTNPGEINGDFSDVYESDIFIAEIDGAGTVKWAISAAGQGSEQIVGISLDYYGELWIAGNFNSPTLKLGDYIATNSDPSGDSWDIFAGVLLGKNANWIKNYGTPGDDKCENIDAAVSCAYITNYSVRNGARYSFVHRVERDHYGIITWRKKLYQLEDNRVLVPYSGGLVLTGSYRNKDMSFDGFSLKFAATKCVPYCTSQFYIGRIKKEGL